MQAELIFLVGLCAAYSTWNKLRGFANFFSLMKISRKVPTELLPFFFLGTALNRGEEEAAAV